MKYAKVKCPDCMQIDVEPVPDHYTLEEVFGELSLRDGKADIRFIRFICDICGQQMETVELLEEAV